MLTKIPILLSFYALSNGRELLIFGQLTYTRLHDLTFKNFNRRRTFRTLIDLYRTKNFALQSITLQFDTEVVKSKTDKSGAFFLKHKFSNHPKALSKVLLPGDHEVKIMEGLYTCEVHHITSNAIVISDIDDTLLHSFISNKFRKFHTLMFTAMEKRRAVTNMRSLVNNLFQFGAATFYLSNSEQNLYPLIYRFLTHNKFPAGPLFLKQMRKLWDVIRNIKTPKRDIHKVKTLEDILSLFPDKKFVLIGDNTQHDLTIYLNTALKYPDRISYILIRKVVKRKGDEELIRQVSEKLSGHKITIHYSENFPENFDLKLLEV
jgi:phosphatidate phosphatase APP1